MMTALRILTAASLAATVWLLWLMLADFRRSAR